MGVQKPGRKLSVYSKCQIKDKCNSIRAKLLEMKRRGKT
jgi:hypothetical protein